MAVHEAPQTLVLDIPLTPGPRVLLRPSFALTLEEGRSKITGGSIRGEGTLVLEGEQICLENVEIADGAALVIHACAGARVTVKGLKVANDGFQMVRLTEAEMQSEATPEYLRIRGYRIEDRGAKIYAFTTPGVYVIDASGAVAS